MATRINFTGDEWRLLLQGASMAGMAVTAADPNGVWGTLEEAIAAANALDAGRLSGNELVAELVIDLENPAGRADVEKMLEQSFSGLSSTVALPQIKVHAIEVLRQVSELLDAKAPNDSLAVKDWLREIARSAAEASREGGFLGFGGARISDAERATLAEIDEALGRPT